MAEDTTDLPERRYSIGEVSRLTGVPDYVLRQWETHITQLRPGRTRSNRRYYSAKHVEIVRRVKTFVRHEGMTLEGASQRITAEIRGGGAPRTPRQALLLAQKIVEEARSILALLGPETSLPDTPPPPPPPDNIEVFRPGRS